MGIDLMELDLLLRAKTEGEEKIKSMEKAVGGFSKTGVALMGVGIAATVVSGGLEGLAAKEEKAQATLQAAVEQTGAAYDKVYKEDVEKAIGTQARFNHNAVDTQEALAKLTIGFKDPKKALEELGRANEYAAMKHISLTEAAAALVKVHAGGTKILKDFGINMKESTVLLADETKATKAHDAAVAGLSKAQQALAQLEARDAGVKKLSIAQQQQLAAAHALVNTEQGKVATTTIELAKAQQAVNGVSKDGEARINTLLDSYHGAERQADTFSGRLDAMKTRIENTAGGFAKQLGPALVVTGPLLSGIGGIMSSSVVPGFLASAASAVTAAAAFLLPLLPFILLGAAVVGIGFLIATHWKQITAWTKKLAEDIGHFFEGAWSGIKAAVVHVVDWIKANWPLLLAILLGPFGLAVGLIVQHFDEIKRFASRLVDDVAGFFGKLPGRIWDAMKGLAKGFADLGKDIVDGLVNGVENSWHFVTDKLGDLAKSLPGPLKNVLGIKSPSTVFAKEVGLPIAQGIAAGITGGSGHIDAALSGVVGVPSFGSVSGGRPGGGLGPTGSVERTLGEIRDTLKTQADSTSGSDSDRLWKRMVAALESIDQQLQVDGGSAIGLGAAVARVA